MLSFGYFSYHDSVSVSHIDVGEYERRWQQQVKKYGYLKPNKDNLNILQLDSSLLEMQMEVDSALMDTANNN